MGGSYFGMSGVGNIFGMPEFNKTGVVAEWNNLNIPYSDNPGVAVSVAGHEEQYVVLDNLAIEITYDNSSCPSPIATDPDASSTTPGTPVSINLLGNDTGSGISVSKIDGQTISSGQTITLSNGSGTVTLNPDNTIIFTPASGFTGTSNFSYSITDGSQTIDTGVVVVTVTASTSTTPTNPSAISVSTKTDGTSTLANTGGNTTVFNIYSYLKLKWSRIG